MRVATAAASAPASPLASSVAPSSAAPSPTASRATTRRNRAMSCTKATARAIRPPARAVIGPAARCTTAGATSWVGAARDSSALKLRVRALAHDQARTIRAVGENLMKHMIIALAAAGLVAAALPTSAQARCDGCAVGAGVLGGLAAGAIIGGAIANSPPRYVEPVPVYGPPPPRVYYEDD